MFLNIRYCYSPLWWWYSIGMREVGACSDSGLQCPEDTSSGVVFSNVAPQQDSGFDLVSWLGPFCVKSTLILVWVYSRCSDSTVKKTCKLGQLACLCFSPDRLTTCSGCTPSPAWRQLGLTPASLWTFMFMCYR